MSVVISQTIHRILVVDDEVGWRDLLSFELGLQGYEVTVATQAEEALSYLHAQSFDLVITDVRMPGSMDGIDLIKTYGAQQPNQKSIFLTGYAIEEKLTAALTQKSCRCLKKPVDLEELFQMIRDLLS